MLINRDFFIGPLGIGDLGSLPIQERVDYFIETHEPEFLEAVLGYELYTDLREGVLAEPVLLRWTYLLIGREYIYNNRRRLYKGLLTVPVGLATITYNDDPLSIEVGGTGDNDPVGGENSVVIPASIVGMQWAITQRNVGLLIEGEDYEVTGSTLTLLNGAIFSDGDRFFYTVASMPFTNVTSTGNRSIIANYVYCKYKIDQISTSTSTGEIGIKLENAERVKTTQKIKDAWNAMCVGVHDLWDFIETNRDVYPQWSYDVERFNRFRKTNAYGI